MQRMFPKKAAWLAACAMTFATVTWAETTTGQATSPDMSRVRILVTDMNGALTDIGRETAVVLADTKASHWQRAAAQRLNLLGSRLGSVHTSLSSSQTAMVSPEDYQRLLSAYLGSLEYATWLNDRPNITTQLVRVQSAMDELSSYYGGYPKYRSQEYVKLARQDPEMRQLTVIVVPQEQQTQQTWSIQPQNDRYQQVQAISTRLSSVRTLAQQLEKATDEARKQANLHAVSPERNTYEKTGLRYLNILENRADRFAKAVGKSNGDLSQTREEFEELLSAWVASVESWRWVKAGSTANEEFTQVQRLMDELVGYYGGYPNPGSDAYEKLSLHVDMDGQQIDHDASRDTDAPREEVNGPTDDDGDGDRIGEDAKGKNDADNDDD